MKSLLQFSAALLCLAAAYCFGSIGWTAHVLPSVADAAIEREADRTRSLLIVEALEFRRLVREDVLARVDNLSNRADKLLTATERDANRVVAEIATTADRRLGDALERADRALATVEGLRADLKPTLDAAALATAGIAATTVKVHHLAEQIDETATANLNCKGNGNCWPAGVTAALGGIKVATGETGQAMRRLDASLPQVLADVRLATAASAEASQATATTMKNIAAASKPLPAYFRIPLQVLGLAAPVASGVAGTMAATGSFK